MNRTKYQTDYYQQRREERLQYFREHYQNNKERILTRQAKYRENNPEKIKRKHKRYYPRVKEQRKSSYHNLRQRALERLGTKCARCGFSDWRALQIDHIQNNGYVERKKLHWKVFYKSILEMDEEELREKYQILCANCNWIMRHKRR